jgi:hypothetical protein
MNSNKKAAGIMLDVRIILAVLWVAEVLSSLNGDTYRLSDPVALKSILSNNGSIVITPVLLLVMSIIFVVPIFMSVLTLTLKYTVSRWVNRVIGIFYTMITLCFCVVNLVLRADGYEYVWATAQFVFTLLVVWYAWKWPRQQA